MHELRERDICLKENMKKRGKRVESEAMTEKEWEAMRKVDVRTQDIESLRDIREVHVQPELEKRERVLNYLGQIQNPYCFRCGKYVVKVSFAETDVTLEDCLSGWLCAGS